MSLATANIIGSILTPAARYCEHWESGAVSDDISDGVRTRTVTAIYNCYKEETRTIAKNIPVAPDPLYTVGGRNPDGTPAESVNWGEGFEMVGLDVSEETPNMSRLQVQYQADDPVSGAGVSPSGAASGGIIGKPWEGGRRYVETPSSGKVRNDRVWLADSFGWNRARNVDLAGTCLKTDVATVLDAISTAPAQLQTNSPSGAAINWGERFELVSISGQAKLPSLYEFTAKYRRNYVEAIFTPPDGVELTCTDGICYIKWQDVTFEAMDSGVTGGIIGIDVQLSTEADYEIHMRCNEMIFSSFQPTARTGNKVLEWEIDGGTANLMWCGEIWKSYAVTL